MTAAVVHAPKARHIRVNGHKIHLRFEQQVIWAVVLGLLATAAVAAVYYWLTQKGIFFAKASWDGLFTQSWWTTYRHGLRNVGEGVLAKFVVETFIAKWQKHPDVRLSGEQMSLRIPLLLIESLALIIAGIYVVSYGGPAVWHYAFSHYVVTGPKVGGTVTSVTSNGIFAGISWSDFIVGFVAAHILRGQWRPIGNTINLAFIEKRVDVIRAKRILKDDPDWLPVWVKLPIMPPTVRERVSWMLSNNVECRQHSAWMYRLAAFGALVFIALAADGEYILHIIAK